MADFKDVIIRLQENKNDNREALKEQTQELSTAFTSAIKSQNRSFGQSLSLQQGKSTKSLESIAESLAGLTTALGVAPKVEAAQTAELEEGSEQEVSSLGSVYDVLLSIDTNFKEYFSYNKQRDAEAERKALNQPGGLSGGLPVPLPVIISEDNQKKGGLAKMFAGAGALAAGALASAKGIATMGLAISAFFGGLVLGNRALELTKEAGFDFDMNATKAAAKGFSDIVQELSPQAMVALGGIIGASAIIGKGGKNPATLALSVGLMGAAITAFFGGLLLGDTVLEGIGSVVGTDLNGFKSVIAGFDSVISEMSNQTMIALGGLIGAAAIASTKGGPLKGQAMGIAIATLGLAISGFFVGLVAGNALLEGVDILSGSLKLEGLKTVVSGFNDVISELSTESLTALGVIFGLSFLTSYSSPTMALKVGYGMTAIGAGISGFFVGLAAGDAAMSFLGTDFTALPALVKSFGEAIGSLDETAMIALGALLGAGGLIGTLGGAGGSAKVAAGMTAVGAGIAGFMIALAGADFVASVAGDGSNVKALVTNFGEAIASLDNNALIALGALLAAGAVFGPVGGAAAALGMTVIGAGIAGFFLAFEGLAALGTVIGLDGSNTKNLIINMGDGLRSLDGLDGDNLIKLSAALAAIGPAILLFLGSEGIAGVAKFVTDSLKGAWNWLTGKDDDGGDKKTIIDQMVDLLLPVEKLNDVDLDGFLESTNALTEFLNNDYMKGADDFEYFVNKLMTNMPKLEAAIFGDGDIMGLAYNEDGYIQASKNIKVLRNALAGNLDENTDTRFGGNMERANANIISSNSNAYQTNNNSTYAVATSSTNKDRTAQMYNNVNGSFYDTAMADF